MDNKSQQSETQLQTVGQLERELSQKVQALYRSQLGHQPTRVICQLFDTKLAIILEGVVTQPEQLLAEDGRSELAEKVRADLNQAIRPFINQLIEQVLNVEVLDLLSDAKLETDRTGIIAVLSQAPKVRNPSALPKFKRTEGSGQ